MCLGWAGLLWFEASYWRLDLHEECGIMARDSRSVDKLELMMKHKMNDHGPGQGQINRGWRWSNASGNDTS